MDEDLVVRAQGGDRDAFEQIVNVSFDRSHGVAMRLLRDSQLAEDAVQQAMVSIWRDHSRTSKRVAAGGKRPNSVRMVHKPLKMCNAARAMRQAAPRTERDFTS